MFLPGFTLCVSLLSVPEGGPPDVSEGVEDRRFVWRRAAVLQAAPEGGRGGPVSVQPL